MALSLPSMKERSALGTSVGPTFLEIADKVLSNVLSTYALDPKRYENPFAPDTDSKFVLCQYCDKKIQNASKEMSRHRASKTHWARIKRDLARYFANNGMGHQVVEAWNIHHCFPCPIRGCSRTLPYRDDCINSHLNRGKHDINSIQDALRQTHWLHGHCFALERRADRYLVVTRLSDFESWSPVPLAISSAPASTLASIAPNHGSGADQTLQVPLPASMENHRHFMDSSWPQIPGPSTSSTPLAVRFNTPMGRRPYPAPTKVVNSCDQSRTGRPQWSSPTSSVYFPSDMLSQGATVFVPPPTPHLTTYNPYAIPEITIADTRTTGTPSMSVMSSVYSGHPTASKEIASNLIGRVPFNSGDFGSEFLFASLPSPLPPRGSAKGAGDEQHRDVWPVSANIQSSGPRS